jgi:septal ring factor EnvC (AmiA/AmiB activator)
MEIEELSNNIQRVIAMLHQIHAENDALKCEVDKSKDIIRMLNAENDALKSEIEKLHDLLRRQEYEMRMSTVQHDDRPERMGRILPYDDKTRGEPSPAVKSGGGSKKTSI